MSQKVWLGGIYLKEEGGYDIVLRSLHHYKKRLKKIGSSPELKDAPTFAQIVQHEASKTGPQIEKAIAKLRDALENPQLLMELESEVPLFEKALNCYYSDIQRAQNNSNIFYSEFISDMNVASSDLQKIKTALVKILQFA